MDSQTDREGTLGHIEYGDDLCMMASNFCLVEELSDCLIKILNKCVIQIDKMAWMYIVELIRARKGTVQNIKSFIYPGSQINAECTASYAIIRSVCKAATVTTTTCTEKCPPISYS